jgi:hypothetical protein
MTEAHSAGESAPALQSPDVPPQAPAVALEKAERKPESEPAPQEAKVEQPSGANAAPAGGERITFQSMAERLTLGLVAAAIGGVLVFISAFLTWSSVDARSVAGNRVAGATIDTIGVSSQRLGTATLVVSIAALATVGVMLLPATKAWAWQVLLGSGALIVVLAVIELLSIPGNPRPENFTCPSGVTCTFHRSIGPGVWFTLVAGLVVVAGAYIHHIRPVPFRASAPSTAKPVAVSEPATAQPVEGSSDPSESSAEVTSAQAAAPADHSASSASAEAAAPSPAIGADSNRPESPDDTGPPE